MRIIELRAENIKRLSAVEIRPDGAIVEIAGKNKQGKTSILDAIWWALAGTKNIQAEPIRDGAESALIRLDLGDYIVRRTLTRKKPGEPECTTTLKVETPDGLQLKQPQSVLDGFLDTLTFDPLLFLRAPPNKQFDMAKRFVPDVDFQAIEAANLKDVSDRRDWNRDAETRRRAAALIDAPATFEPIDEKPLLDKMSEAADLNEEIAERRRRRVALEDSCAERERKAERLRAESEELSRQAKAKLDEAAAVLDSVKDDRARLEAAEPLPDMVDFAGLRQQLDEARAHNAKGARAEEKKRLTAEAEGFEKLAAEADQRLKDREEAKRAAIAAAKIPVDGLQFGQDCILLNGKPFDQASDAEQLRTSIAVAMAGNPELRVIRVRDGSLLDHDAMRLLADLAAEKDFQIWIERVEGDGKGAFIIEDGAVARRA